ncbi:hypothetical protein GOV12_02885 [Candidatus Pacearchaeota archaeon]|nr:hypothetical protein [Candidatus Pacearchaeota archaeon]
MVKNKKKRYQDILLILKITFEIFIIQAALTLVLGLLAVMFYNFKRISIISLIPGLIGTYLVGKKYVYKQKTPLENNIKLFSSIILIILNILIFFIYIDRYLSYNLNLLYLILILEIVFVTIVYWILGLIKK